jgi:RNA polymerase sigma-70 factor (ECF subfamily)
MGRLERAKAFDRQTLANIYDDFYPSLYRYISRQVSDMETAQDLTADVFQRFLQALDREQGPDENLQAWLYRAAHNVVVDHYRRQEHRRHLPLPEQLLDGQVDPVRSAEINITAEKVHEGLLFLAGFSNKEVAAVMNKPIGAVKSLQHRGLAALQRQLIPEKEQALA